jgi:hypothetical protein
VTDLHFLVFHDLVQPLLPCGATRNATLRRFCG